VILTNARELRKLARAARYALLGPNKKRKIKNRTNSQRKGCLYIFRLSERKYRSPSGTTVQIRTRTNSHELDGNSKKPKHARAKAVKRSGKIKKNKTRIRKIKQKSRKPKENPLDLGVTSQCLNNWYIVHLPPSTAAAVRVSSVYSTPAGVTDPAAHVRAPRLTRAVAAS
jgi:hypothetical protein